RNSVARHLFFVQAEDGIRDSSVTGVQTCALPISIVLAASATGEVLALWTDVPNTAPSLPTYSQTWFARWQADGGVTPGSPFDTKIGRASCRERVEVSVVEL